jgi:hypothetical protein
MTKATIAMPNRPMYSFRDGCSPYILAMPLAINVAEATSKIERKLAKKMNAFHW